MMRYSFLCLCKDDFHDVYRMCPSASRVCLSAISKYVNAAWRVGFLEGSLENDITVLRWHLCRLDLYLTFTNNCIKYKYVKPALSKCKIITSILLLGCIRHMTYIFLCGFRGGTNFELLCTDSQKFMEIWLREVLYPCAVHRPALLNLSNNLLSRISQLSCWHNYSSVIHFVRVPFFLLGHLS